MAGPSSQLHLHVLMLLMKAMQASESGRIGADGVLMMNMSSIIKTALPGVAGLSRAWILMTPSPGRSGQTGLAVCRIGRGAATQLPLEALVVVLVGQLALVAAVLLLLGMLLLAREMQVWALPATGLSVI